MIAKPRLLIYDVILRSKIGKYLQQAAINHPNQKIILSEKIVKVDNSV